MRISKGWKIGIASTLVLAATASTLTVLLYPIDMNKPITTYDMEFSSEIVDYKKKNKAVNDMKASANDVMSEYKSKKRSSGELNFSFANLTSGQSAGELNYYNSMNKAFRNVSPNIGITNHQRTPELINEAFYNRNTEMQSFYWSPDYNGIGTWVKYMLTDNYVAPNMWPATYAILNKVDVDGVDQTTLPVWAKSLKDHMENSLLPGGEGQTLYMSPIEILNYSLATNVSAHSVDNIHTYIANAIGKWISDRSKINVVINEEETQLDDEKSNVTPSSKSDKYKSYQLQDGDNSYGIMYIDWINSFNSNLPLYENGPDSQTPKLVTKGLFDTNNPNTDQNMRDWYLTQEFGSKKDVNIWTASDPFKSTVTPWNPAFSKTPNTIYAQSIWTNLTSWSTTGNSNDKESPFSSPLLVSEGMKDDFTDDLVKKQMNDTFEDKNKQYIDFKIRPIQWVDSKGQPSGEYLSPQDFWAGVKAFQRSLTSGINSNNAYFEGLVGIDFEKTLEDENNHKRNEAASSELPFRVYFNDPLLGLQDTIDILQKQYFSALPAFVDTVQNITDDEKYNEVVVLVKDKDGNPTNRIDEQNQDWTKFYGCGVGSDEKVYGQLYSTAPYYIHSINEQHIQYKINKEYFEAFKDETYIDKDAYKSFVLETKDKKQKRIETITNRYAGSYSAAVLFNSFTSGELDVAPISGDYFNTALKNEHLKKQIQYIETIKINKSNFVGFNLQIYEKSGVKGLEKVIIGINPETNKEEPMAERKDENSPYRATYSIDEYGNYVWPKGWKPKIKSRVSQEYADLIASNFYTPLNADDSENKLINSSAKIRATLTNTINWASLATLYSPGVTTSIQTSFMPYGVYELDGFIVESHTTGGNGEDPIDINYWEYSANKKYLSEDQLNFWKEDSYQLRTTGILIWTYSELLSTTIKESDK
ncbi:MAG: MG321/MPN456 family lipoprotein [Mycoplasma sp.]